MYGAKCMLETFLGRTDQENQYEILNFTDLCSCVSSA